MNLLVVEDDLDMREMLAEALEEEGYQVAAAASGREALLLAGQRSFALVITDVRMGGMDGLETLAALKQLQPGLRSIIITGYASDDAPVRAIKLEAWDYLYKPFSLEELLAAIRRVLHAEVEREKSQRLLASLSAGFRRLLDAAAAARANHQLQALERLREQAWSTFHVAVRSRNLRPAEGLKVWDELEALEGERDKVKAGERPEGDLTARYQYLLALMSAFTRDQGAVFPERKPGQVSRAQFAEFYKRLQLGEIPAHQLSLAPFLRTLDALTLGQSAELSELQRTMWGSPSA